MATTQDDQKANLRTCKQCGGKRALDQRYCISCGARLGSLPAAIKRQFGSMVGGAAAASTAAVDSAKPEKYDGWPFKRSEFMPSPRTAAAAVLVMLGLGVALGSVTQQLAQSAGFSTILLESPPPVEEEAPEVASVEPEVEKTGEPAPAAVPSAAPAEVPPPLVEEPLPSEPPPPEVPLVEEELPAGLPEIKHVFVVMLGEGGYEENFGKASQSKFLGEELPAQGELLSNYYAVTKGQLANEIALLSGQGPTLETAAGCPNYGDVTPGSESAEGQVEGNGCVYPATTKTLPGQLAEAKLKWKAYVEGVNPFLYFHSIIDGPEAGKANAGLPQLATDLKLEAKKFPALAYISPGPASPPEEFLKTIVPEIKESLAYKDGGMLLITFAQAPQGVENPDESGCCINPSFPNLPPPPSEAPATGPVRETGGGGRVGLLLLSPYVEPGTTSETFFNHFSILVTIEELFGLERIGYGTEPALTGFDESIFNAGS
ncbi:MAG: alkaline phosphatase family protein [Solirubrobacterales bacterium]